MYNKCPKCFGELRKSMQFEAQLNRNIPILSCITCGNEVHAVDIIEMAKSILGEGSNRLRYERYEEVKRLTGLDEKQIKQLDYRREPRR
tara:strand:- start:19 stop:285 length:267 start_codon:yes stop_codon:yes gene_type:complete